MFRIYTYSVYICVHVYVFKVVLFSKLFPYMILRRLSFVHSPRDMFDYTHVDSTLVFEYSKHHLIVANSFTQG